jgi:sterol desaturase/sphingolipid hydroxylase (fatty acid hydroxylase superfamily)
MKYFTALRLLEWMVTLSLIAISFMKFNIVTLIIVLIFAISLWLSIAIYRRNNDVQDDRIERIKLRSCAFSYTVVIILIMIFFLLARFIKSWPNTQFTLLMLWAGGSLSREIAEYYYRFGK